MLIIDETVERIHARHSSHSMNLVHEHLRSWLKQGGLPGGLLEDALKRWDSHVPEWAEEIPSRLKTPIDKQNSVFGRMYQIMLIIPDSLNLKYTVGKQSIRARTRIRDNHHASQ